MKINDITFNPFEIELKKPNVTKEEIARKYAQEIYNFIITNIVYNESRKRFRSSITKRYYFGLIKNFIDECKRDGIKFYAEIDDDDFILEQKKKYIVFSLVYVVGNERPFISITLYKNPFKEE